MRRCRWMPSPSCRAIVAPCYDGWFVYPGLPMRGEYAVLECPHHPRRCLRMFAPARDRVPCWPELLVRRDDGARAERNHQFASIHHSITSSGRTSSDCGIVMQSALGAMNKNCVSPSWLITHCRTGAGNATLERLIQAELNVRLTSASGRSRPVGQRR